MAKPPLPIGTWGEIWTKQIGPKKWEARTNFRDLTGKTRPAKRRGTTKTGATNRLKEELTTLLAVDDGGTFDGATRFGVLVDMWLEGKTKVSSRTRRRYGEIVRLHLKPRMGDLLLRECSTPRLTRVVKAVSEDAGASTATGARKVLRMAFSFAVEQGALQHSPADKIPVVETESKDVRAMTFDERTLLRTGVRRWEQGLPPKPPEPGKPDAEPKKIRGRYGVRDLADLVDVLFATGGRIGESLALRWSDVDLQTGKATLAGRVVWEEPTEKGGKRILVREQFRKGHDEILELQLPRFVVDALLARKVNTQLANVHDAIFPSANGYWRDPNNVRKQWRKVRDDLGLDWVTPHTLRKTVATILNQKLGTGAAAQQLGHSDEGITRKHYIERAAMVGPDARDVLNEAILGTERQAGAA